MKLQTHFVIRIAAAVSVVAISGLTSTIAAQASSDGADQAEAQALEVWPPSVVLIEMRIADVDPLDRRGIGILPGIRVDRSVHCQPPCSQARGA